MTSVGSDLNTRGVTITERIMMSSNQQTTDQPDNDYQKENWMSKKHEIQKLYFLHKIDLENKWEFKHSLLMTAQ